MARLWSSWDLGEVKDKVTSHSHWWLRARVRRFARPAKCIAPFYGMSERNNVGELGAEL